MSLTIKEYIIGPIAEPWETPRLMFKYSVVTPSTTALCLSDKKLVIQLMICGFRGSFLSLSHRMLWGTVSNALLKSNGKILIDLVPSSSHFSQVCWHLIRAMVELCPVLYANWSESIATDIRDQSEFKLEGGRGWRRNEIFQNKNSEPPIRVKKNIWEPPSFLAGIFQDYSVS